MLQLLLQVVLFESSFHYRIYLMYANLDVNQLSELMVSFVKIFVSRLGH